MDLTLKRIDQRYDCHRAEPVPESDTLLLIQDRCTTGSRWQRPEPS